jgi:hypothetical protein
MSLQADPHFQKRAVKSIADLVCVVPTNFTSREGSSPTALESEDFAFVRDENSLYTLDPDSLVAPDVSIGFPYGRNVVFARTALQVDPALLPTLTLPAVPSSVIGDANKPGRWFRYGSVSDFAVSDIVVDAGTGPVFVFADLVLGTQRAGSKIKVSFSCGLINDDGAAATDVLFELIVDGGVVPFRKSKVTLGSGVGVADTVTLEAVVDLLAESLHTLNIRATCTKAAGLGATINAAAAGTGHATLTVNAEPF